MRYLSSWRNVLLALILASTSLVSHDTGSICKTIQQVESIGADLEDEGSIWIVLQD